MQMILIRIGKIINYKKNIVLYNVMEHFSFKQQVPQQNKYSNNINNNLYILAGW